MYAIVFYWCLRMKDLNSQNQTWDKPCRMSLLLYNTPQADPDIYNRVVYDSEKLKKGGF